jgi:hypothetical protein
VQGPTGSSGGGGSSPVFTSATLLQPPFVDTTVPNPGAQVTVTSTIGNYFMDFPDMQGGGAGGARGFLAFVASNGQTYYVPAYQP